MPAKPKFTDGRSRYHSAEESKSPGYLARRFEAYKRLQRMQSRTQNVTTLHKRKVASS